MHSLQPVRYPHRSESHQLCGVVVRCADALLVQVMQAFEDLCLGSAVEDVPMGEVQHLIASEPPHTNTS